MDLPTLLALMKKRRPGFGVTLNRFFTDLQCRLRLASPPSRRVALRQMFQQRRRVNALRRTKKTRRWWVRPIFQNHATDGAWFKLIPLMKKEDPEKYYNFFRMHPESFDYHLNLVGPHIEKKSTFFREAVCQGERLAITLRFYASGDSFMSLSYVFLVSDQLISEIVFEVSTVLWEVLEPIAFEPICEDLWLRTAAEYEVMWNFPHCVGGIDGRHCHIKAPPHCGSRFFNYKKRHSLILMGVADANRKFLMVDIGASGRRGVGNVFHSSTFGKALVKGQLNLPPPCPFEGISGNLPFVFIGDGAFERSRNLLNPFTKKSGISSAPERVFNTRLSGARHCAEDAFGILCKRFEVLETSMEVSKTCARKVMLACCALHNIHLMNELSVSPKWNRKEPQFYSHQELENGHILHGRYKHDNPEAEERALQRLQHNVRNVEDEEEDELVGEDIREVLLDYFIDHPTPWQWCKSHVL